MDPVFVLGRPDAREHDAAAHAITFRDVAHMSVLSAHLLQGDHVAGNPEGQRDLRVRGDDRRIAQSARARGAVEGHPRGLDRLRRLRQGRGRVAGRARDRDEQSRC